MSARHPPPSAGWNGDVRCSGECEADSLSSRGTSIQSCGFCLVLRTEMAETLLSHSGRKSHTHARIWAIVRGAGDRHWALQQSGKAFV